MGIGLSVSRSIIEAHDPGRVMTYKSILRELWGPSAPMDNKILRVHMASIRRKIENDPTNPQYIFTEVGVGYRIAENTQETDDYS